MAARPAPAGSTRAARFAAAATRGATQVVADRIANGGSGRGGEREQVKRSPKAYVSCVERATDTAALEKCQPLLP